VQRISGREGDIWGNGIVDNQGSLARRRRERENGDRNVCRL